MVSRVIQSLLQTDAAPRLSVTRFADMTYDLGALMGDVLRPARRDLRDYSTATALLGPDQALLDATGATPRTRPAGGAFPHRPAAAVAGRGDAGLYHAAGRRLFPLRRLAAGGLGRGGADLRAIADKLGGQSRGDDPALWPLVYLPAAVGAAMWCC